VRWQENKLPIGGHRSDAGANPASPSMNKIHPRDYGFVPVEPDPDFSEEKNRAVIKWVIEETDRIKAKKMREFDDKLKVRTDAVSRFIERIKMGKGDSEVKTYFGKKTLDYLSGRDERQEDNLTVIDSQGQVIRRPGDKYGPKKS